MSKTALKKENKEVLKYIKFGEQHPRNKPYSERPTCKSRITMYYCNECGTSYKKKPDKCKDCNCTSIEKKDWYNIEYKPSSPLLHFEVETNRELTFIVDEKLKDSILNKNYMTNYGYYNLNPKNLEDIEVIAGILNSTFGVMMMEFGGRYLENRDGTISNATRVYELKDLKSSLSLLIKSRNTKKI